MEQTMCKPRVNSIVWSMGKAVCRSHVPPSPGITYIFPSLQRDAKIQDVGILFSFRCEILHDASCQYGFLHRLDIPSALLKRTPWEHDAFFKHAIHKHAPVDDKGSAKMPRYQLFWAGGRLYSDTFISWVMIIFYCTSYCKTVNVRSVVQTWSGLQWSIVSRISFCVISVSHKPCVACGWGSGLMLAAKSYEPCLWVGHLWVNCRAMFTRWMVFWDVVRKFFSLNTSLHIAKMFASKTSLQLAAMYVQSIDSGYATRHNPGPLVLQRNVTTNCNFNYGAAKSSVPETHFAAFFWCFSNFLIPVFSEVAATKHNKTRTQDCYDFCVDCLALHWLSRMW